MRKNVVILVVLATVAVGCGKFWTVKTVDLVVTKARVEGRTLGQEAGRVILARSGSSALNELNKRAAWCAVWLANGTSTDPEKAAKIKELQQELDELLEGPSRLKVLYLTESCEGDPVCETSVAEFAAGIAQGLHDVERSM